MLLATKTRSASIRYSFARIRSDKEILFDIRWYKFASEANWTITHPMWTKTVSADCMQTHYRLKRCPREICQPQLKARCMGGTAVCFSFVAYSSHGREMKPDTLQCWLLSVSQMNKKQIQNSNWVCKRKEGLMETTVKTSSSRKD